VETFAEVAFNFKETSRHIHEGAEELSQQHECEAFVADP
jgi:hypothetical protein